MSMLEWTLTNWRKQINKKNKLKKRKTKKRKTKKEKKTKKETVSTYIKISCIYACLFVSGFAFDVIVSI